MESLLECSTARAGHLYSLQPHGFFLILKYFHLSNIPIDSVLLRNPHLDSPSGKTRFLSHADKHINPGSIRTHQYPRKSPEQKDLISPANPLPCFQDGPKTCTGGSSSPVLSTGWSTNPSHSHVRDGRDRKSVV